MILELNPARWFTGTKTTATTTATPTAAATEDVMATAPVVPAAHESGFKRFIDEVGVFFKKDAPVIEEVAIAAEPILALSPFGPEYDLVVNAIYGVQKTASASLAAGVGLTGEQKMALVLQASSPALTTILASKNVTSAVPAAIAQFAQNVYNLQTGPVAVK